MLSRFWGLIQPKARGRFIALAIAVLLGGIVELVGIATVANMMQVVATGGENSPTGPLGFICRAWGVEDSAGRLKTGLLFSIIVLAGVHGFTALRSFLRNRFVCIQDMEITSRLFSATLEQPYSYFLTRNSAELQHLLLSGGVTQGVINGVLSVMGHLSIAVTLTLALIWTDPLTAFIGGLVVTVAYGMVRRLTRQLLEVKGGMAHLADRQRRRICQEALTGIRFVKTTGREEFFLERFREHSEISSKGMVYHAIYVDVVKSFLEWVTFAGILTFSVYLILQTRDLDALLPRLTLYTMAVYRIVPAIHDAFGLWTRMRFDSMHLKDTVEILNSPELGASVAQKPIEGLREGLPLIRFENVSFRYPTGDRPILNGVKLEVQRCEWIGIVGSTGAGKTTMLDLMAGLTQPTEGQVVVGETVLTPEFLEDWRRHIGVVPQEVILIDDTLLRNVAFGLDSDAIDPERVAEVCRAAGLSELIETLSDGYDTSLGDRGLRLSGGERQRVGIARALYRRPQLLLLDEATSALDQATEARIVTTLRELARSCTLITVAHRLSSVKPCDRILVMEHGKIAAQGTYDQLVRESKVFQELALVGRG